MKRVERTLLTLEEGAGFLGVGRRTMARLVDEEGIPVIELGPRIRRIPLEELEQWARERVQGRRDAGSPGAS